MFFSKLVDVKGSKIPGTEIQAPFFERALLKIIFTARSLRSLETLRALSLLFIVFSPERGENTMNQALRAKQQISLSEFPSQEF